MIVLFFLRFYTSVEISRKVKLYSLSVQFSSRFSPTPRSWHGRAYLQIVSQVTIYAFGSAPTIIVQPPGSSEQ